MTRRVSVITLLVLLMLSGAVALTPGLLRERPETKIWSLESPNKTYKLTFTGTSTAPSWPFTQSEDLENHKVVVDITSSGITLVRNYQIYDGDAYDSSFNYLYPNSEWISENTIHLWDKNESNNPRALEGHISISNQSNQIIKYLYVKAGKTNLFLLFDLMPGGVTRLPIHLQHWEDLVGCEGKLAEHDMPYRSADFSKSAIDRSQPRYSIIVKSNECFVTREE